MLNKIDNLLGLNAILNGEPIGLRNHASQQHRINIGENNSRKKIDHSSKVRWNLPLDVTYVYRRVISMLYKSIFIKQYGQTSCFP
jgi:hypothetical protein